MRTADDHAAIALGIEILASGDGRATAVMVVREDMTNAHGITHGGMVFALADTAFGVAANSSAEPTVCASAQITYLAPTYTGQRLTARAARRVGFGRSAIYDVTVTDDAGDVVAEYRGSSRTLRSRPAAEGAVS